MTEFIGSIEPKEQPSNRIQFDILFYILQVQTHELYSYYAKPRLNIPVHTYMYH